MLKKLTVIVLFVAMSVMFFSCQDINSSDTAYIQDGSSQSDDGGSRDYEDWGLKW